MITNCTCKICGKQFYVRPSHLKRGDGVYCSKSCLGKGMLGKNHYHYKELVEKPCLVCGKIMLLKPYKTNGARPRKVCSIACRQTLNSGVGQWNWKGGISVKKYGIRHSREYYQWRKDVFERDGYQCWACGARNGLGKNVTLQAHHIEFFSANPRRRFDLTNGITLCQPCHKLCHKTNLVSLIINLH